MLSATRSLASSVAGNGVACLKTKFNKQADDRLKSLATAPPKAAVS